MDKEYLELKKWLDETADEPLEEMDAFFNARIDGYEEHMSPWKDHYQWMARQLSSEWSGDGSMKTLLDIGCGSGLELDCIFERFPSLHVTGVDMSEEMLAKLSSKHAKRFLNLIQADYFIYPLGENCYDAAVSFETLHHFTMEKKKEIFTKLYRCLKPGGIYLECDYIAATQKIEDLLFAECERRRRRDGISPETFVHFDTPLTLEHEMKAMREAGFDQVELIDYLDGTPMIRAVKKIDK